MRRGREIKQKGTENKIRKGGKINGKQYGPETAIYFSKL